MNELHGFYLEELEIGMRDLFSRTINAADIVLFAGISGDTNPVHLDEEFASKTKAGGRVAHGMLSASFISTVIGTKLPGPGCLYVGQSLKFRAPVRIGDTVRAVVTVKSINESRSRVILDTTCYVGDKRVITGDAEVWVPKRGEGDTGD